MGYQGNQRLPSEATLNREEQSPPPAYAPPLPPRNTKGLSLGRGKLQAGSAKDEADQAQSLWASQDPRAASTESLVPQGPKGEKRTLLLVYIHGFLGDETSFQSFPAHVHSLTTYLLSSSHVVHTKIYPKYKSRRAIEFARDDFSNWLRPHESLDTDIILLGHSMGGILSAEVCLKKPEDNSSYLQHRILGSINFDVPFLGMHPGVVVSGISSLFRPGEASPSPGADTRSGTASNVMLPIPSGENTYGSTPSLDSLVAQQQQKSDNVSQSVSSYFPQNASNAASSSLQDVSSIGKSSGQLSPLSVPANDPNFNPRFENDVILPVRKGWENALHFINKHAGGLTHATKTYVTSHFEFGGTMADYRTLHQRYKKIRAFEDVDDVRPSAANQIRLPRRIRFVNYYSASTGRPKQPKSPSSELHARSTSSGRENVSERELKVDDDSISTRSRSKSPKVSVEGPEGRTILESDGEESSTPSLGHGNQNSDSRGELDELEPKAVSDEEQSSKEAIVSTEQSSTPSRVETQTSISTSARENGKLPPIPSLPSPPADFDASEYQDKDVLKLAEKDYARRLKNYKQAVKDRDKAIAGRQKMLDKREKSAKKEQEKALKADKKAKEKAERQRAKQEAAAAKAPQTSSTHTTELDGSTQDADDSQRRSSQAGAKPPRDRKFCLLPSKGPNGERDSAWIRVYMEGVDEVGAHCGLFFFDRPHYQKLVNDVGAKIQEWVERDRFVRESS